MKTPLLAALCATLALGACGSVRESRINPFNWFGKSEKVATTQIQTPTDANADLRPLVDDVTGMVLEKVPGGVIVRATGLPGTQGWWDAELTPRPLEDGVLVFEFHTFPPVGAADVSTPRSREIVVAAFVSDFRLDGVRQITVQGARNARTSRR